MGNRRAPTQCPRPSNAATVLCAVCCPAAPCMQEQIGSRDAPATASKRSCHDGGGGRHAGRLPPRPHAAPDPAAPGLGLQTWLLLARLAAGAAAGVSLLSRSRLRPACMQADPGSAPSPEITALIHSFLMRSFRKAFPPADGRLLQPSALSSGCRSSRSMLIPLFALISSYDPPRCIDSPSIEQDMGKCPRSRAALPQRHTNAD